MSDSPTREDLIRIVDQVNKYNIELKDELERERLRLAACGVAALGYFDGCKEEYKSASLTDVIRLYSDYVKLQKQLEKAESVLEWYADHENWTCNNLEQIEPSIESSDCYDGDEFGLSEYLTLGGRRAKEYFKEKE